MNYNKSSTEKLLEGAKEYFDNNLTKDIAQPITERLKNPLFLSFVITFIVVNWDVILYFIFSHDLIEYKIGNFHTHYASFTNQLFKPLIASLIYTVGSPYILSIVSIVNFDAKKHLLSPSNNYKLLEAESERKLQKAIAEGTDFALDNKRNDELEKLVKLKDIQLAEATTTNEKYLVQLQETNQKVKEKDLEIERIKTENIENIRKVREELGNESNNFSSNFIKIFNELYSPDKFNPELFQDSFTFKKSIQPKMLDGFKSFMKDRMKYFGLFTVDIITKNISNSETEFTVYFHYPNFKVNENTKNTLIKMFTEVKI